MFGGIFGCHNDGKGPTGEWKGARNARCPEVCGTVQTSNGPVSLSFSSAVWVFT